MKKDELLDLVDKKDKVIGSVWKSEAHKDPSKIHREVAIAVFNGGGEVLLQQRSISKKHHPGRWAITAGHVGKGEKPSIAARRELFEELGWKKKLIFLGKLLLDDNKERRFFWIYYLIVRNRPKVVFESSEIMDIKWVDFWNIKLFSKDNDYYLNGSTHKILTTVANKLKLIG